MSKSTAAIGLAVVVGIESGKRSDGDDQVNDGGADKSQVKEFSHEVGDLASDDTQELSSRNLAEGSATTSNGNGGLSLRAARLGSRAAWFGSGAAGLRGRAAGQRSGAARPRGRAATTSSIVAIGGIGVARGRLGEELLRHTDCIQVNAGGIGK